MTTHFYEHSPRKLIVLWEEDRIPTDSRTFSRPYLLKVPLPPITTPTWSLLGIKPATQDILRSMQTISKTTTDMLLNQTKCHIHIFVLLNWLREKDMLQNKLFLFAICSPILQFLQIQMLSLYCLSPSFFLALSS
jgi:hypothetical protein